MPIDDYLEKLSPSNAPVKTRLESGDADKKEESKLYTISYVLVGRVHKFSNSPSEWRDNEFVEYVIARSSEEAQSFVDENQLKHYKRIYLGRPYWPEIRYACIRVAEVGKVHIPKGYKITLTKI